MKLLAIDETGVQAVNRALYRVIAERYHIDVTLVVPRFWRGEYGSLRAESEQSELRVLERRVFFSGKSHRAIYAGVFRLLRKTKPDVLYVNAEPESFLSAQCALVSSVASPETKLVFMSWRNIDYPAGGFPYKCARLHDLAERIVLKKASHCIAHNQRVNEILMRKGFHRITIIPPPVDTAHFVVSEKSGASDVFTVGFAGRFIEHKGIDILLRAVSQLPFRYRVMLLGRGPEENRLREYAESLGVGKEIQWLAPCSRSEVIQHFKSLDVLVLPSITGTVWKEQFGRVLIEAMACGVPVVGSTSGEIPNVIGDAGLVFQEGDPTALASAINTLRHDNELRSSLVRKGLERVQTVYSVERVAEQYVRVFQARARA